MKKSKGFTLVEIIVSIAIGSIVLLIAGGIILSSSNFLTTTTEMDLDKRCIDSITDYVRDEIKYSTDVRFIEQDNSMVPNYLEDSDWHYFYIKDNELYHDGARVFDKNFTNKKNLSIAMKGDGTSQSNQRLDIKYNLVNNKNEVTYTNRDTVIFLNLSTNKQILEQTFYTSDYKQLSNDGYWLFYANKDKGIIDQSDNDNTIEGDGTVADQLLSMDLGTNRWFYSSSYFYREGDRVFHNGYWWLYNNTTNSGCDEPGVSSSFWKRLTSEWTLNSKYSLGDVIIYNGKYYRNLGLLPYNPVPDNIWNKNWEEISEEEAKSTKYEIKPNEYANYDEKTIISKLDKIDLSKIVDYDPKKNSQYPVFFSNPPTDPSGFVRILDTSVTGTFYHYYYRVFNNDAKPGEKSNGKFGWQEIKLDYDENSAYVKGDSILSVANNGSVKSHFEAQCDILTDETLDVIKNYTTNIANTGYYEGQLYSNYLNPGGEYNTSYGLVWKKLY